MKPGGRIFHPTDLLSPAVLSAGSMFPEGFNVIEFTSNGKAV